MNTAGQYFDSVVFGVLPYLAFSLFFFVTIQRYRNRKFTYSSLSSQFLENRQHFWGLVPFHYGILIVLTGHIVAFLFPREILLWNSKPARLYILEAAALICGLLTLVGLLAAVLRRIDVSKVRRVTTVSDWILYALLLVQISTGIGIALFYPWGSSWYAASISPYLWSILKLNPQFGAIAALPWLPQLHIINAYIAIGFFPFTRLVHVLVAPNPYLWRKPQVVRWNWNPATIRKVGKEAR